MKIAGWSLIGGGLCLRPDTHCGTEGLTARLDVQVRPSQLSVVRDTIVSKGKKLLPRAEGARNGWCRLMRRAVTTCAVVCLLLTSAGQSVANVSMSFADSWSQLEAVESQSCVSDTWFTLAGLYPFSGEIVTDDTAGETVSVAVDALWTSSEPAFPPVGCFGPGRELPPDTFAGLYFSNAAYPYVDLADLGEISAIDGLVFQPALPSGAILLGGLAVGLIGWLWRRRNLSCEEYP